LHDLFLIYKKWDSAGTQTALYLLKKYKMTEEEYRKTAFYPRFSELQLQDISHNIQRIGIIPYVVMINPEGEKKVWFALAVDKKYGELTDFGGMKETQDDSIYHTASRELLEESINIFNLSELVPPTSGTGGVAGLLESSPCVTYSTQFPCRRKKTGQRAIKMCTIFVDFTPVYKDLFDLHSEFQSRLSTIIFKAQEEGRPLDQFAAYMENLTSYWIPANEFGELLAKRTPNTKLGTKNQFHNSRILSSTSPMISKSQKPYHPYIYEKIRISIYPHFTKLLFKINEPRD
jgi:hypothetical protein